VAPLTRQQNDFRDDGELERELLTQPAFAGATLKFVGRLSAKHSQSLEYSLQWHDGARSIFVKQQAPGPDAERATLQEFANLGRIRSLLGLELGGSVPEPLLALPKRGILVTSKVPGIPLTATLKKYANRLSGPFCVSALAETGLHIGRWLRSFQDATPAEPLTYDAALYLADLERWLSQIEEKGFRPGLAREILQQASCQSAAVNGRLISAAASHGDFIAQNILIEEDGVGVVDFEGFSEREAVYDDLGMFLGYIFILAARAPYSPQSLDAARRGFLKGFLAGDAIDHALLNIYILKGAVRIIADGPPLKENWRRLRTVRKLTKRLTDLASGAT
jgi:hypothetical protein